MSNTIQQEAIIMSLKPLFEKAEADGLWFYHDSSEVPDLWASPEYLSYMHEKGRMIWSPEHWELRNPVEYLASLRRDVTKKVNEYNDLAKRLQFPDIEMGEATMGVPNEQDASIANDMRAAAS